MINNDLETYKKYIEEIGNLILQDSKVDNLSLEELEELKNYQSECYINVDQCLEIINNIPTQDKLNLHYEVSSSKNDDNQLYTDNKFNDSENNLDQQLRTKFEDINNKVDLLNSKIDIKEQTIQEQNLKQLKELKEQISESNNYSVDETKYSDQIQYLTNQVNFLLNKINSSNTEAYLLEILNLTKKINQIESSLKYTNSPEVNPNITESKILKNSDDSSIILDKMKKLIQEQEILDSTKSSKLDQPNNQISQDSLEIDKVSKSKNIDFPKAESTNKKDDIESIKKMIELNELNNSKGIITNTNEKSQEMDKINPCKFSKNKNPFDYVYDDVSDLAFSKKSLMTGGGKLHKLKLERKKIILGHLKQQN